MVWDATQPTNTTKLRNLGVVIRPNWEAIEQGDSTFRPYAINFTNRTPLVVPNNPVAIANAYILYSKQDAAGAIQLYGIDSASRVTQISVAVSPSSAARGYTWLAGGMLLQWGLDHASGSASTTITFPVAFSGNAYNIQTTMSKSSGGTEYLITVRNEVAHAPTATQFKVYNPNSGHDFYWTAIGPKV